MRLLYKKYGLASKMPEKSEKSKNQLFDIEG